MLPVCSGRAVKFWCAGVPVPGRLTRRIGPGQVDLADLPPAGRPGRPARQVWPGRLSPPRQAGPGWAGSYKALKQPLSQVQGHLCFLCKLRRFYECIG